MCAGVQTDLCKYTIILHSDQGANLTGEVVKELCNLLGIKRSQTSAYHPQGNGQTERFNWTLEAMLAKSVDEHQEDWSDHLPILLMAYRTSIHESTKFSPFHLNFGKSTQLPIDIMMRIGAAGNENRNLSVYTCILYRKSENCLCHSSP